MKMPKFNILLYVYMLNATVFMLHEMDAVFWREWELFGISQEYPGLVAFILAHIVLFMIVFHGMLNLDSKKGLAVSLVMSVFGMVHFLLHTALGADYFITNFSSGIINAVFALSSIQLYFTVRRMKELSVNNTELRPGTGSGE